MPVTGRVPCVLKLAVLSLLALAPVAVAQDLPSRPPGMTDQQIQQAIQQRGLGEQLRQRIAQSGMTADQVRARLRAAGYSEGLLDAYLGPQAERGVPAPTLEALRSAAALGFADFAVADSLLLVTDSLYLTRSDSFLLDTLGLVFGRDSIATVRDSLGRLRVDTAAVRTWAERTRRPRVFGLDVFRRVTSQFNVASSGPVDPADYRLGPGDELVLVLTGDVELAHQLVVTREGFVVIPQVGQIAVSNLTLNQFRTLLSQRLARVYSGVRASGGGTTRFDVTLTRVRVNQVLVIGEVARPGSYAVSALGSALNALYQAGGPTERGSFRDSRVMRGGELFASIDLYDYLLGAAAGRATRVESGDIVYVPPYGTRVTLEGPVFRPAIYELEPGQGLRDLITMAGGLLPEAYTGRASIERILPPDQRQAGGRDRAVLDVDLAAVMAPGAPSFPLVVNDRVRILGITLPVRNRVTVRGNVWHPGSYAVTPGLRLSQMLTAAGGLRTDTYYDRAHIVRVLPDSTRRMIPVDLRVVTTAPGSAGDPELQEFDEVTIYSRTEFRPGRQIAVYGSVQRPGQLNFRDAMTLRDAVILAGGLRDEAWLMEAEVSRLPQSSGGDTLATIIHVPLDSSFVTDPISYLRRPTSPRSPDLVLQPFDNVFIRRVPGFTLPRNVVVSGEVRFPGRYTLTRVDERLSDILQRAGGLNEAAYVRGTQFHRAEGRAGRVGLDVERVLRDPSYRDNLIMLPGDSVHVPLFQPVVVVEGSVNSPVAVAYEPGRDGRWYVDRAGGATRRADAKRTYIVQPNGSVLTRGNTVEPGARVVVPEKPQDENRPNWAAIVTTASAALASLLSIVVLAGQL
jgi:protein involved in polysaccharide export with SLBB domain